MRKTIVITGLGVLGLLILGLSGSLAQEEPPPRDELPCADPCPGWNYEAVADAATGKLIGMAGYDPTDPDEGHLLVESGQFLVEVPPSEVLSMEADMTPYSADPETKTLLKNGVPVVPE
jgi:hypothetical protein